MVNWYNVISLIIGSSLIVSVAGIIANNFILVPHLDIQIKDVTNKEGKLPELHNIIITNNG